MGFRISVDTGGTFTDIVVMDEAGQQTIGKALTTKSRIFVGMREAIEVAARDLGMTMPELLAQTDLLIYGTTRATNAIVTRTVAKTAFVTTMGFPDTLVLKEGGKVNPHDFTKDYPEPYIPRRYTFEIEERMSAEGTVSVLFNEPQARSVVQTLKDRGFEAVAVCFLWSIANPEHELRLGELLTEIMPDVPFTLSHQLVPIVREYRRASATAIDASLKPLMQDHLRGLEDRPAGGRLQERHPGLDQRRRRHADRRADRCADPYRQVGPGDGTCRRPDLLDHRKDGRQRHRVRHRRHDLRRRPRARRPAGLQPRHLARRAVDRAPARHLVGRRALDRRRRRLRLPGSTRAA